MGDPKSPKQPAWKRASGAPAPDKQAADKRWQANQAAGPKPPVTAWGLPKWARVGLVAAGLVAVAGVAAYVVTRPKPDNKPHFVLIGAGYEKNLAVPHNVAGVNGLRELEEAIEDPDRVKRRELRAGGKELEDLFERSFFSRERIPKEVVVFVAAHGVAHADGDRVIPCLIPDDYDPGKPAGLIDVSVLLKRLEKLPEATQKLLVLDVAGIRGDWSLGQFHPTFLQALEKQERELADIPNLVVLVSADKDEFSRVAPEWGTTIFAHHFIEALKGATGKEIVDVEALHEHVKKKVSDWARHNRARSQKPRLIDPKQRARHFTLANFKGADRYEPPQPREAGPAGLKECAEMWEECLRLEKQRSPWLTDPVRWRKYQDCLLRVEELLRAGDEGHAAEVRKVASNLKEVFEGAKAAPPASLGLTLAMPDVLAARPGERGTKWLGGFAELVKGGKYEDALKELDRLPKVGDGTREQQLLRNRAAGELVRAAAADPKAFWGSPKGQELLGRLEDPTEPSPAEMHYLVMLRPGKQADGPLAPLLRKDDPKSRELLRKALRVRLLAEEAAAGLRPGDGGSPALSAEVLAWTRKILDKADGERRKGQDLLFTSEEVKAWPEAEKALDDAASLYEKARDEAGKVRRAILARDRALAELPYYTRWLARRPPASALGEADEERLVKKPWQSLRELDKRLNEAEKPGARKTDDLPALTDAARKSLDAVKEEYRRMVAREELAGTRQDTWHEIDGLLRVPVLDRVTPGQRVQLLKKIHEISQGLQKTLGEATEDAKGVEGSLKQAQEEAQRNARFALETLRDRPDVPSNWAEKAEAGLFLVGQWVADQQLQLATEAEKGRKAAEDEARELPGVIRSLGESAALARRVEGWAFEKQLTEDPTRRYRDLLLHRFLCWQAERAYLDHWAAADPTSPEPYYRAAGLAFTRHARALLQADAAPRDAKKPDLRAKELLAVEGQLKSARPFAVEASPTGREGEYTSSTKELLISDESSLPRWHCLRGPKDVPGQPVAWVEFEGGVQGPAEERLRHVEAIDKPFPGRIEPRGELGKRPRREGKHTVKAYFRGHESKIVTPVTVAGEPDLVVVRPPQNQPARLSVQARRDLFEQAVAEKATLAIVLDCSGSMVTNKLPGTNETRWDAAKAALRQMMQELPRGVQVSLRAFGAKDSPPGTEDIRKDISDLKRKEHGKWTRMERVWRTHRWNPDNLEERMRQVSSLEPSGATPLLRAMWAARQDFPPDFEGRRILVVVTDGGDSNFYDLKEDVDRPLKEKTGAKTLEQFLQFAFKRDKKFKDIELHVIGFDIRESKMDIEERRAAAEMPGAVKKIGGEYHDVKDSATLARKLSGGLLTMDFVADADDSRPGHDRRGGRQTISSTGAGSLRWLNLPADRYPEYTVRLPAIPGVKGNVSLQPGDRLALELVPGDRLPKLRRMLYARSPFLKGFHGVDGRMVTVKHEDETWVAAGLQNYMQRGAGDGRLSLLATLEQEQGPQQSDRYVQTVRPRWTWFEVHGPKGQAAEVRVFPVGDYPAPAWGLEVADWPSRDDPVRINAWWTGGSFTNLARRHTLGPGQSVLNLKEKPWDDRPEKEAITIESVRLEPCSLRLPTDEKEGLDQAEVRNCLVVRLRYPKDPDGSRPIFVQPGEREWPGGQAHRWFHQAGKYTGIFWPVTEKTAAEIRELLLFSVPELKAKSVSATLEMGKPDHESRRPGIP
jgi:Mg-chelatase subunit ChlD